MFERIITSIEQGINWYATETQDGTLDAVKREQYMIGNFREILNNTKGRKIFAIMGWGHASLNGPNGGPPIGFTMASVLKNEIRIASIVLRQQADPNSWQYIIRINENLKTTPFNSTYTGNWPWPSGWGFSEYPVITRFVVGIDLADSNNGIPEKTVFNKGDQFIYGFQARDSKGDWKQIVHTIKYGGQSYDRSWNLPDRYIGSTSITSNSEFPVSNFGTTSGTYEMTWYILDQAGNKSNVITRTITVN